MRLVRTEGSDAEDWSPRLCTHKGQPYAILSHRWFDDPDQEVLFTDIEEIGRRASTETPNSCETRIKNVQYADANPNTKPGFKKLQGAARRALHDGLDFVWVDACCIDKNSSAELSEAINSMWKWYGAAEVCYVYLVDVLSTGDEAQTLNPYFAASNWWTRGWTLQELLSPRENVFLSSSWEVIGRKNDLDLEISTITKIDPNIINGTLPLTTASTAQRMSWASHRETTRIEDIAYCLIGLFGVNMPLLYGEGEKAFLRLQHEIIKHSDDESIFAWRDESMDPAAHSSLFAARPSAFAACHKTVRVRDAGGRTSSSYGLTNGGLEITLRLADRNWGLYSAMLLCADPGAAILRVGISLRQISRKPERYVRVRCNEWTDQLSDKQDAARVICISNKSAEGQSSGGGSVSKCRRKIRVFKLLPTEDVLEVVIDVMELNLDTSRYTAISYVRDGKVAQILTNRGRIWVDENVLSFLDKASWSLRDDLFWIDQLSDNQQSADTLELFNRATKVIIWLGRTFDVYFIEVQTFLQNLDNPIASSSLTEHDNEHLAKILSALIGISTSPYWSSAHTRQQSSTQVVTIETESFSFVIEELHVVLHAAIREIHRRTGWAIGSLLEGAAIPSLVSEDASTDILAELLLRGNDNLVLMSRVVRRLMRRNCPDNTVNLEPEITKQSPDVETLLKMYLNTKLDHPQDANYAQDAINQVTENLRVDYSKPPIEIFFEIIDCIGVDRTMSVLTFLLHILGINPDNVQSGILDGKDSRLTYKFEVTAQRLSLPDDHLAGFQLEHGGTAVEAGLRFTKMHNMAQPQSETKYRLSGLYTRGVSREIAFTKLPPSLKLLLTNVRAIMPDKNIRTLVVETDRKGLIALGFCGMRTKGKF